MKIKLFLAIILVGLAMSLIAFAAENHAEYIEGPVDTPQEITEQCLTCHEEAGEEILNTRHWNWLGDEFNIQGHGKTRFGKQNMLNNFCIAVPSNWPRCTSCHISYGWADETFDHSDPLNIDCLVCHDQTGTYQKPATGAGMPDSNVDLLAVAKSVGPSSRKTCGSCHFYGGGGNGVKHGDLDLSMLEPSPELDVHMGGQDFSCAECHTAEGHQIRGASHGSMAQGVNRIYCLDCHDREPHEKDKLNAHTDRVACETCHIPTFAREWPSKMWWDWSTAGQDLPEVRDENGKDQFDKKKGSFTWEKNVRPVYRWYNGSADYYQIGDKIKPDQPVALNSMNGSRHDKTAQIYPFKLMKGKQIYDSKNNYLIVPHLYGENGFWKKWDWNLASEIGMASVHLPYSGSYDFVETEMYIPIHHMVAPADQSLKCYDCHHKTKSIMDWPGLGYETDPMSEKYK